VEENIDFFSGMYNVPRERRARARTTCSRWPTSRSGGGPDAHPGRRLEAAVGARLRHPARSAGAVPGRADFGRGPIARGEFWKLIHDLAETHHTIFVSTHYMDEAEYCGRLALMYRGKVIALGRPRN